jgi:hypothetical protein
MGDHTITLRVSDLEMSAINSFISKYSLAPHDSLKILFITAIHMCTVLYKL